VPSCVKFESLATPVKYQLTYIGQICETRFAGFFVWLRGDSDMSGLLTRTLRIRRGIIHRLMGFERLYETTLTDGWQRVAYGRGETSKTSQQWARRNWDAKFSKETES
jgi:hypothetical protein